MEIYIENKKFLWLLIGYCLGSCTNFFLLILTILQY